MTKVSEDQMQPGTGLLPTAAVDAARASKSVTGDSQTLAGSDMYSVMVAGHHDKEYYDKWNKDRQEAIARGEDPNAKFLALVKEKEQQGYQGKIRRFFKRLSGSNASGHPVIGGRNTYFRGNNSYALAVDDSGLVLRPWIQKYSDDSLISNFTCSDSPA